MNNSWTMILLGMSGDLAKRKLLPAFYDLVRDNRFEGSIIGTGREPLSVDDIIARARPFMKHVDAQSLARFRDMIAYQQLSFDKPQDYQALSELIAKREKETPSQGRIAYLATAADFYCTITQQLLESGIIEPHNNNHRIVYEKPFGADLASAKSINACIKSTLLETQVYRIDHYLAKEFVNNLLLLRYSNTLFKSIWNGHTIEAVNIFFSETIGLEGRGSFYDRYGVLKDVIQNHVLQIMALVAMEEPVSLEANEIRDKKADVLKATRIVDGVLGQYEGYKHEKGVAPDSQTPTYAALKAYIETPLWRDVPFYLVAGKELNQKRTEVQLILKPVDRCLWSPDQSGHCSSNILTIHLTPTEGFSLQINTKKPGTLNDLTTVDVNFSFAALYGPISPEAYEVILTEVMAGSQAMVVRFDEIEYQWDIIDSIEKLNLALHVYLKGSSGPALSQQFLDMR